MHISIARNTSARMANSVIVASILFLVFFSTLCGNAYAQVNWQTPGGSIPTQVVGPTTWIDRFNPVYNPAAQGWADNYGRTINTGMNGAQPFVGNQGMSEIRTANGQKIFVPVGAAANLSKGTIAQVARAASRFMGPIGAASLIKDLWDESGLKTCAPPDFICGPDQETTTFITGVGVWRNANSPYELSSDPAPECTSIAAAYFQSAPSAYNNASKLMWNGFLNCQIQQKNGNYITAKSWEKRPPAGSCATGTQNGVTCTSIVPGQPYTDAELEQAFLDKMNADPAFAKRYMDAVMSDKANNPLIPIPELVKPDTPITVTGTPTSTSPRTVSVTTTPRPDGSTDTTTVTEQTTVTPTTTGTTVGTAQTTYPSTTTTTTTVTNNVTNNTTTSTTVTNNVTPVTNSPTDNSPRECGSPGKPACKIDETGTPEAPTTITEETYGEVKEKNDDLMEKVTNITPQSVGMFDWFPQIPTTECRNPTVPNPITGSELEVEICKPFNLFKQFITAVLCFFCLLGCVREVQQAMKA